MINLAGNKEAADKVVKRELLVCGIPRFPLPAEITNQAYREVQTQWFGKLGDFEFKRAWYYWVVSGRVPIQMARELYVDPCGRTDIRVAGHCGCPPPEKPWVEWYRAGKKALDSKNWAEFEKHESSDSKFLKEIAEGFREKYLLSNDPEAEGFEGFVTSYHIDTEVGLRVFVDTLRRYRLVP